VRPSARTLSALLAGSLLGVQQAGADERLARRLAALEALVRPEAPRAARPAAARPASARAAPPRADPACAGRGRASWPTAEGGDAARVERAVRDASLRFGVDADLIHEVIRVESNYDASAVSVKGARGLMQLMPDTARLLGVVCVFDPRENVMGGTRYLADLRRRLGSWPRALAGYHAGPRRVEQGRVPAETRRYVRRILGAWRPQLLAWMDLE
jgi:soluble lytic murein transglycosylase-like protein